MENKEVTTAVAEDLKQIEQVISEHIVKKEKKETKPSIADDTNNATNTIANTSFYARLIKAKNNFSPAKKDTQGFGYKYADLSMVIEATDKALHEQNILVWEEQINDNIKIFLIDAITGDRYLRYDKDIVSVQMAKANEIQQEGAGITYLRRYGRLVVLGIAPEDDDAAGANPDLLGKGKKQKYTPEQLQQWRTELAQMCTDHKVTLSQEEIDKLSACSHKEIKDEYGDLLMSIIRNARIGK